MPQTMLYSLSNNIRKAAFCNVFRVKHSVSSYPFAEIHGGQNVQPVRELDELYKTIVIETRAHDSAVLNSYEWFVKTSAGELGINISNVWEPFVHKNRKTLLKSVHIHGKHRVQYEFRTYFRLFELKHLTGSTADTFLEYIQRNLPEGVAMKVTKHRIEKIPEHIPVPKDGKVAESVKL